MRTITPDVGCDMGTKCIVWVKVNPDYEILFRLMDRLRPDAGRGYWIREDSPEGEIDDMGEYMGQMTTEVKIALPMSDKTNTCLAMP